MYTTFQLFLFLLFLGKGDVISCDYKSLNHIPKANADLVVCTIAEIHSVNYEDLMECLRVYPEFGETFFQSLQVSYSLQEDENVNISFTNFVFCLHDVI